MSEPTRYPLCWPPGRPRTERPTRSKFDTDLGRARDELLHELRLLGASDVVLSSNLRLRLDGLPYADQREPDDAGVAVYFRYKGRSVAFACDRWNRVRDNVQAIRHTIEALRGIARWGTGDMVEAAFTGFAMLPPARSAIITPRHWWDVLGCSASTSTEGVTVAYREKAKRYHPDRNPGDEDAAAKFAEVSDAWERFKRERGL